MVDVDGGLTVQVGWLGLRLGGGLHVLKIKTRSNYESDTLTHDPTWPKFLSQWHRETQPSSNSNPSYVTS